MKRFCDSIKHWFVVAATLWVFALPDQVCVAADLHPNSLTTERITALPTAQRNVWQQYVERSATRLRTDQEALSAELKKLNLAKPIAAPEGPVFKVAANAPLSWYRSDEAQRIADAMVSFQTPSGGWSKGVAFDKGLRQPGMHWTTRSTNWYYVGTFDNRATTEQLTFLAKVRAATKASKYFDAFVKGLDYIFDAQFPNGGWPQVYPLVGDYHDEVTFNDDSMIHVLEVLRDVASLQPEYSFVDEARRLKARNALNAGVRCILRSQIRQNGKLTVWCAQHDPLTLAPAPARKFEPASLSGGESVNVVRFLMKLERPGSDIVEAVESAVAWFNAVKINNIEIVKQRTAAGGNAMVAVPNPHAPPLWARFYELGTNRPIFVGRDAVIKYQLADLDQERGQGYDWYVNKPQALLEKDYPKWRAQRGASVTETSATSATIAVPKPQLVVASDGSGDYKTVQEAVDAVPARNSQRFVILIKPGIYKSHLVVPKDKPFITLRGEDAAKTILTNDLHVKSLGADGKEVGTIGSASTVVSSNDFSAENITFENDAPHVAQALAIYIQGDRAIFRKCLFLGWQDTIRVRSGRQYFEECTIAGRTDFIYGEATSWFERCHIHVTQTGGWITAANTPQDQPYGLVFSNCTITGEPGVKEMLGRPWRPFAHTVWLNTRMADVIAPEGWNNWGKPDNEKTVRYAEYNSRTLDGKPVDLSKRVSWAKQLNAEEAAQYTISKVLGDIDNWNPVEPALVK
jgi:pectinesterase